MTGLQEATATRASFDPASRGLGVLITVVGAHGGAGASGVALALADALDARGLRVLLVDGADSARSGLAEVWTQQLRTDPPTRSGAMVTTVRRGGIVGRQARRRRGGQWSTTSRAPPHLRWSAASSTSRGDAA